MIIWNARRIADNNYFLYVGIAFLFFAFLDVMHVLGNKDMGVLSPEYGNMGPTFYIASRYFLSISLVIAPLFIYRKLNTTLIFAVYSLVTLLILLSIFYWHIFPVCIVEGVGLTPFKVVSDYIICLILLGATGLLLINRRSFDSRVLWLIVSSLLLSIATGLAFALYSDPFGIINMVGHWLQVVSFYLIYLALIAISLTKPQDILYRKLKQSEKSLAENVRQVNHANVELKQEIAERKRTAEALRESRMQLDLALRSAGMGMWYLDLIENKRYFDDQACHLLGINPATFTGADEEFFGVVHPDDWETIKAALTRAIEEDVLYEPEYRTVLPDGSTHYVIARGRLVRNDLGRPQRINGILWDITERKLAEEKLRKNENQISQLLQTTDQGIYGIDLNGCCTFINRSGLYTLGYRIEDCLGRNMHNLIHHSYSDGAHYPEKDCPILRAISTGAGCRLDSEVLWRRDGTSFPAEYTSHPILENGKISGAVVTFADITERKMAEVALQASLAEQEVLLREVHHRVKNNLAAIIGLVDMQRQALADASARTSMEELSARIKSMSLVHEQLYCSDTLAHIDFQKYLETLTSHLHLSYDQTGTIRVSVAAADVSMGLDKAVPCGLLITELLTNAFKYAFPGGQPRARADRCEIAVSASWDGTAYTLAVADNGVGMPEDFDWTTTETLGLTLVGMLGEHQLQGKVLLDRSNGTTFRLQFAPKNQ